MALYEALSWAGVCTSVTWEAGWGFSNSLYSDAGLRRAQMLLQLAEMHLQNVVPGTGTWLGGVQHFWDLGGWEGCTSKCGAGTLHPGERISEPLNHVVSYDAPLEYETKASILTRCNSEPLGPTVLSGIHP